MEQHASSIRAEALAMIRQGASYRAISERLGVPRGTIGWWRSEERRAAGTPFVREHDCPRCRPRDLDRPAYSYLLGLYLGDGHIVQKSGQRHLSVYCSDQWARPHRRGGGRDAARHEDAERQPPAEAGARR
jgi:hypothetical protein